MNAELINKDWTVYEEIKRRQGANPQTMNLDARRELNYLADLIQANYPELQMDAIKIAIYAYTQLNGAKTREHMLTQPNRRDNVLKWVLKRLEVGE